MRALIAIVGLYSPNAFACAVCGGAGQNQQAFVDTMIFMSAMPLLMIGFFVLAVWWLSKQAEAQTTPDDATTRTTSATPPQ